VGHAPSPWGNGPAPTAWKNPRGNTATIQNVGIGKVFSNQGCIYLTKNTVKTLIKKLIELNVFYLNKCNLFL